MRPVCWQYEQVTLPLPLHWEHVVLPRPSHEVHFRVYPMRVMPLMQSLEISGLWVAGGDCAWRSHQP
jgi:hypothetical protein